MSFKFCGIEIPDSVKVVLSFEKEEDGFTFVSKLVNKSNGIVYMRTNPRPVTEIEIDLPWDAVLTEKQFGETFIRMLVAAAET